MSAAPKAGAFGRLTTTRLKFKGDAAPASGSGRSRSALSKKSRKKNKKDKKKDKKRAKKAKRKLEELSGHGEQAAANQGGEAVFVPVQKTGKGRIITSGMYALHVSIKVNVLQKAQSVVVRNDSFFHELLVTECARVCARVC